MPSLDFKGKQFVYAHHLSVPFRQLDIDKKKSLPKDGTPSLDDNLIIHGDNLHALKALLPKYAGKVKCIYIDPPYNTGNEGWCYNDKVNAPMMKEWLKKEGNPVDKEDLERHDKWLCMMWPRLHLLRELLADDGVIFISIDDNEVHHLRMAMDEIFGIQNFASELVWANKEGGGGSDSKNFRIKHEYIVCYCKDIEFLDVAGVDITNEKRYNLQDKHVEIRGKYYLQKLGMGSIQYSEKLDYKIETPDGEMVLPGTQEKRACWRWSKEKLNWGLENDFIVFKKDKYNVWQVYTKQYLKVDNDANPIARTNRPFGLIDKFSSTQASKILEQIFGKKAFDYSKDKNLISYLLKLVTDKESVVLDSFAGSGTTAHAVLDLNKEDGGNRKFILVEMEDYANDVTAERVRRVINGVPDAKDDALKEGLGGSFTFCDLGQEINIENLLKGEKLPEYDELARYAFYTATGLTLDDVQQGADYFIGETENYRVHLIYKPDLAFLRSGESALNMPLAKSISAARDGTGKSALVFATHKFMGQKELTDMGITYCQLPYAIHRVMGD